MRSIASAMGTCPRSPPRCRRKADDRSSRRNGAARLGGNEERVWRIAVWQKWMEGNSASSRFLKSEQMPIFSRTSLLEREREAIQDL